MCLDIAYFFFFIGCTFTNEDGKPDEVGQNMKDVAPTEFESITPPPYEKTDMKN